MRDELVWSTALMTMYIVGVLSVLILQRYW